MTFYNFSHLIYNDVDIMSCLTSDLSDSLGWASRLMGPPCRCLVWYWYRCGDWCDGDGMMHWHVHDLPVQTPTTGLEPKCAVRKVFTNITWNAPIGLSPKTCLHPIPLVFCSTKYLQLEVQKLTLPIGYQTLKLLLTPLTLELWIMTLSGRMP